MNFEKEKQARAEFSQAGLDGTKPTLIFFYKKLTYKNTRAQKSKS